MDQLVSRINQGTIQTQNYDELINEIYNSVTRAEGFTPFIEKICRYLNFHSGDMAAINMKTGEYIGGWQHGHKQEDIKIHIERGFIHQDPLVQEALQSPIGHFIKLRDTIKWTDFIQLDIYKDWGSRIDLFDATGTILSSEGKIVTGIFFQRNKHQELITQKQIKQLNILVPHLQRAVSLYLRLMEHEISYRPLKEVLNLLKLPTVLFDRRGIVSFANKAAVDIAIESKWLNLDKHQLVILNTGLNNKFNQLLSKTVICSFTEKGYSGGVIHADIDNQKAALCIQPMNASNESGAHGGALLFIHQQLQKIEESKTRMIQELFHLTSAEAQVTLLLSQGMTVKAIAKFSGRKETTTRTHLKSAFAKTGMSTQGQLVSLILTSPVFIT